MLARKSAWEIRLREVPISSNAIYSDFVSLAIRPVNGDVRTIVIAPLAMAAISDAFASPCQLHGELGAGLDRPVRSEASVLASFTSHNQHPRMAAPLEGIGSLGELHHAPEGVGEGEAMLRADALEAAQEDGAGGVVEQGLHSAASRRCRRRMRASGKGFEDVPEDARHLETGLPRRLFPARAHVQEDSDVPDRVAVSNPRYTIGA